jgi:hypothetical protein
LHKNKIVKKNDKIILYVIIAALLQIFYSFWAANVAKKLGKNPQVWRIATLFLTIPSLIALGFQKRAN